MRGDVQVQRIIAFGYWLFIGISSIYCFIIACMIWLLTAWFDHQRVILHYFSSFWATLYLWIMPSLRITIHGRDKIKSNQTYVIVSNHQSQLDILVVYRLFFPFKWVSKAENKNIPIIGWMMKLNRYIIVQRNDLSSIRKMIRDCQKTLASGMSVYIFPEGTRSETGKIAHFKQGAFILAKKSNVPILPIVIQGTYNALPKHSIVIHGSHSIDIHILDEIDCKLIQKMSSDAISKIVWKKMNSQIAH